MVEAAGRAGMGHPKRERVTVARQILMDFCVKVVVAVPWIRFVSEGENVTVERGGGKRKVVPGRLAVLGGGPSVTWGGLGGSAVLLGTTRCLSAFAQRLCHACCCGSTRGATAPPGKGGFCFLHPLLWASITVTALFPEPGLAGGTVRWEKREAAEGSAASRSIQCVKSLYCGYTGGFYMV